MDYFERRFQQHIRLLEENQLSEDMEQLLYELAVEYASESPGDYYVALPGIILPLFS